MLIHIIKYLHLLSLVVWVGSITFFSFFAAPSIFKILERGEAGKVVGSIFPKYYGVGYISSVVAITTIFLLYILEKTMPTAKLVILLIMAGTTFYGGMVVGTKAREIKAEIQVTVDETRKAELRKEFGKTHGISSVLNITVFVLGLVVLFMTAKGLKI